MYILSANVILFFFYVLVEPSLHFAVYFTIEKCQVLCISTLSIKRQLSFLLLIQTLWNDLCFVFVKSARRPEGKTCTSVSFVFFSVLFGLLCFVLPSPQVQWHIPRHYHCVSGNDGFFFTESISLNSIHDTLMFPAQQTKKKLNQRKWRNNSKHT